MKKQLIVVSILLLVFQSAVAQQNKDPIKNLDLKLMGKFDGTWEWKTETELMTLVLKKEKFGPATEIYLVFGWYRYIKNGVTIIDELADVGKINKADLAGTSNKGDPLLYFTFADQTRQGVEKRGTLAFVDGSKKLILFVMSDEIQNREHWLFGPPKIYPDIIPEKFKIILKRIK